MAAWLEVWDDRLAEKPYNLEFEDREWMHRTFELMAFYGYHTLLCRQTGLSERVLMHAVGGSWLSWVWHGPIPLTYVVPCCTFEFAAIEPAFSPDAHVFTELGGR